MKDYIELGKDGMYYVKKPFEFHLPKRCVSNIETEPSAMLFGKIYTADGKKYDVTWCQSSITKPYDWTEKEDRYILHYVQNDMFCNSNLIKTIANVEIFYKILEYGQLLPDMQYQSVYNSLVNVTGNNANLDVPDYFYEYTLSVLIRDGKDVSKPLRMTNPNGQFRPVSITQLTSLLSPIVAITSTDPESKMVSIMNKKSDLGNTPIEKTFLM